MGPPHPGLNPSHPGFNKTNKTNKKQPKTNKKQNIQTATLAAMAMAMAATTVQEPLGFGLWILGFLDPGYSRDLKTPTSNVGVNVGVFGSPHPGARDPKTPTCGVRSVGVFRSHLAPTTYIYIYIYILNIFHLFSFVCFVIYSVTRFKSNFLTGGL